MHYSRSVLFAVSAALLAAPVSAADNEWQVTDSTEWSKSSNWSLPLGDTSNELRFRAGSGVLNSDVMVTFADAYEYPKQLKFENDQNRTGAGLVTFRGETDEDGLAIVSGQNILVGWYGSGGYPGNVEFAKGMYSIDNALLVQYGCATISGASLYCGGNLHLGYGNADETALNIFGGSVSCNGFYIGDKSGSKATCVMTNGTLTSRATGNSAAFIGQYGQGEFFFYGGKANFNGQFQIGRYNGSSGLFVITNGEFSVASYTCIGYNSGSGKFIMDGGTFTDRGDVFIVGQGSNASATGECIVSNGVLNVQSMYISENNTCGTLTVEGGEVKVNGTVQLIRNAKSQTATVNLNGGVLSTERFDLGGGSGNSAVINFNGGTLKGVRSTSNAFIPDLERLTVKLGEKGAIFDTAGLNLTVADTLDNADGLDHNAPIAKKGLGTLTISSGLDLDRTFKFVIDGGVGPIALTGEGNTLGEGAKIAVAIDPVEVEMNTPYVLLTDLDASYTKEDNFDLPSNNGFYKYTWSLESGTLSVSLAYSENAPVTARYSSDAWKFYDGNNTLIENAEPLEWTTYIFTGAEPAEELETIGVGHKVVLGVAKDGDVGVTNTFSVASVANAKDVTVTSEEGCAVRLLGADESSLSAGKFTNNGTLILAGTVSVPSLTIGGTGRIVVENGAVVAIEAEHAQPTEIELGGTMKLSKPQVIGAPFSGYGTLSLSGGAFSVWSATPFGSFKDGAFKGVLELCADVRLEDHNGGLGSAQVRMKGASLRFGNDNDAGTYCSNDFEIFEGTSNTVYANKANMFMYGRLKGSGTVLFKTDNQRGPRLLGDVSQFEGICTIGIGKIQNSVDSGFFSSATGSENATWVLSANGTEWYNDLKSNSTYAMGEGNSTIMKFGALQQTGANAYMTPRGNNMTMEIGNLQFGESVLNGKFAYKACTFRKLGATSWLTLGQGFAAVAGSTFNFSAGGICFNLPAGETEPTSLLGHTVTFDPSVKIRVAMTQAQYEALDLNEEYLVAKLPTNPGYKPETALLVDGAVLDTPAAAKWGVRFKSFPAVGETPAYVGAVLCRRSAGLMIIVK